MPEPDQNTAAASPAAKPIHSMVIRPWPKIVLMLPSLFVAVICGIIMAIYGDREMPTEFSAIHYVGLVFQVVLLVNLTMVLYDLNLRGFMIVALLIVVVVLGIFLLNQVVTDVWSTIGKALSVRVLANSAFYFVFSIVLLFNLAIAWVITRFNYWKIEHNEIIIHRGFMQEQERHPTAQARFKLVVEDVVEYALLGAGKLVFYFGDDDKEVPLETVLFAHRKARKLDELLGRVAVVHHH